MDLLSGALLAIGCFTGLDEACCRALALATICLALCEFESPSEAREFEPAEVMELAVEGDERVTEELKEDFLQFLAWFSAMILARR